MTSQRTKRRQASSVLASIATAAALLGVLAFARPSPAAAEQDVFKPAQPELGTEIPAADIKFGMRPYADNTFYIIAMKKGWFKDVGVNIVPPPFGLKVTDTNVVALLLNGQLDISSEYCPLMLPTYKTDRRLK